MAKPTDPVADRRQRGSRPQDGTPVLEAVGGGGLETERGRRRAATLLPGGGGHAAKKRKKIRNVEISSVSNDKNVAIQKKETLAATTNRLKSFIVFKEQVAQNCKSRLASFERNKCSQSQGRG